MAAEGTTDGAVFRAYVNQVLAPTLEPGDVVVMDLPGCAQGGRHPRHHRSQGRCLDVSATVFARLLAHRAVLVQTQDGPARHQSRTRDTLDEALARYPTMRPVMR